METRPPTPTRFSQAEDGSYQLHFSDGSALSLDRRVRFTSYHGTVIEGLLVAPMNAIMKYDEPMIFQLYFQDGIQANWRPEWGETLEQADE